MNEQRLQAFPGYAGGAVSAEQRNRVLRNTYWLLALSLVPTVLGAWVGVTTGIVARMGMGMSFIVFMGGSMGLLWAIEKNKNSGVGVAFLMALTFFMGLMLSRLVGSVLGFSNGTALVMTAFGGTAAVFAAMASLATVIKRDLSNWTKFLAVGAVVLLVAIVANIFLQSSALMMTISVLLLGLASAFMLYDIKRVVDGGETNYITAATAIYLDLFNVFQSLLSLLGIFGGERD